MKTTITISEQEASEILAKYFEAKSNDLGTISVLVERVVDKPAEPPVKPIFNIYSICRQIDREYRSKNMDSKIPCIKMLSDKALAAGISIPLVEAKLFVEQFL